MHRLANVEAKTAHNATLIVTISKYSLEKMKSSTTVDETKVRIVPNGVDTEKFKPIADRESIKRQFGLDNEPCVLFVGSLIQRKGLPFLIEAAKKIVKEQSETKFLIVGEGPLREQLTNSIALADLSANFKFFGKQKDDMLPSLYNCADVFALPSIQEGQGIVLLEAQASSKPVVAFDVGGVSEAVRTGDTGLLVTLGKTKDLADAILKLLSDKRCEKKWVLTDANLLLIILHGTFVQKKCLMSIKKH